VLKNISSDWDKSEDGLLNGLGVYYAIVDMAVVASSSSRWARILLFAAAALRSFNKDLFDFERSRFFHQQLLDLIFVFVASWY
jgi:hypothetical protein